MLAGRWLRNAAAMAALALAGLVLTVVSTAAPAAAHTELLQASPGPGQRAGGEIKFLDLVFMEPVSSASVEVVFDGEPLSGQMTASDGSIIRYTLDEPIQAEGRYEVGYEFVSFDLDNTVSSFFFDYDSTAPEPLRLGVVVEPSGTNWPAVAASVVLMACVAGLLLLFVKRVDARRRSDSSDPLDAG